MGAFLDCPKISKNRSIFWQGNALEISDDVQDLPQDLGVAFDKNCELIIEALADKPGTQVNIHLYSLSFELD
jgi:hypothetical protein